MKKLVLGNHWMSKNPSWTEIKAEVYGEKVTEFPQIENLAFFWHKD